MTRLLCPLFLLLCLLSHSSSTSCQERPRIREAGITVGILPTGKWNAITDVAGVLIGHTTLIEGDSIRTGVTAVLPHVGNLFRQKVSAAVYVGNGFGKLVGQIQIQELGEIETPIILTNTLNVFRVADAIIDYTLHLPGNEAVLSINPVVGETNDGWLNDIQERRVGKEQVFAAIHNAHSGAVEEGNVGAGTGTVCFSFKGGIGTASRQLPANLSGFTVGVLLQANFGGVLQINGVPIGKKLGVYSFKEELDHDGSCAIVVATDAPLSARNLQRLAKRALLGLARSGGFMSNGSGDYVIAFSTAPRIDKTSAQPVTELANEQMSPLFLAVVEATEEAIYNSLFKAQSMSGFCGRQVKALPLDTVIPWLKQN